jgi:hypothetical protein
MENVERVVQPCPFCGGEGVVKAFEDAYPDVGMGNTWYRVVCTACHAHGPPSSLEGWGTPAYNPEQQAVQKWNQGMRKATSDE